MKRGFVVVGRWSRTVYGPFESVGKAESFIRVSLRSNLRLYEVERA